MAGILSRGHSLWFATILGWVIGTSAVDCPMGWNAFNDHCYLFVFHPLQTYVVASTACQLDGSYLLSVNTEEEHSFISQWLMQHRTNSLHTGFHWWTSGIGAGDKLQWEGDGTANALDESTKWVEEGDDQRGDQRLVYIFAPLANSFQWGRQIATVRSPYICEVSKQESYTVYQAQRDFAFGTDLTDAAQAPRGPRFVLEPTDLLVVGKLDVASIECIADAIPPASYVWYKVKHDSTEVISQELNTRYGLTNGRFSFQRPEEGMDAGYYYCEAFNLYGKIRSHSVEVSFGSLQDFSNDPPGAVYADQYQGAYMDCNAPHYKPAVHYQWYRENSSVAFIRTVENPHLFVSKNGGLYFSETQETSAGIYHCIVTLAAPQSVTLATKQLPSRVSLDIPLKIRGDAATSFGPEIHSDFPAVFPSPPLRGSDLSLECFAYGKLPLRYSWRRDNGEMPVRAQLRDHGRTLFIPNAQLEDSGNYTCRVVRAASAWAERTLALLIPAVPYFIFPLRDHHVDVNSTFSIRCEAMALPLPTYAWLKNGLQLNSTPGDLEVRGNVVTISSADPSRHSGIYECVASNVYGTRVSTCQVRVLEFKPSFAKRPLDTSQMMAVGGNGTIVCQPDAAPRPTFTWFKNGVRLSLTPGVEGRVTLLTNGNLLLREAEPSDQGNYTCRAENVRGWTESTGQLTIVTRATITVSPKNTEVKVNDTAFLACEASYNPKQQDLVYSWSFNGFHIRPDHDPTYSKSTRAGLNGIYIIGAQFIHAGWYQCNAVTVEYTASAASYVTVKGPPSEPAGVYGRLEDKDIVLTWMPGATHGSNVVEYVIEHKSNFLPVWRVKVKEVKESESISVEDANRRTYRVTGLSPGSMYTFRVKAINQFGVSVASLPSDFIKVPDAPPLVSPNRIMSGNSSVGTLAIVWNKLNAEDLTGRDQGYKLYWRKKTPDVYRDSLWQTGKVDSSVQNFVTTVGAENYYLEYEVKIAAFNYLGDGPNSSVVTIMSQENLPLATPENVWGEEVNATAMMVHWDPVINTRENMKGKLLGFQINWWWEPTPEFQSSINIYCDDCTGGMVIGLRPNADFWVNVQTFNKAGLGPKGEDYRISTSLKPPSLYPEFVAVQSHPGKSVYVTWRGVSILLDEAPLTGYKMRWWPATEDIRTANDTVVAQKRTWGVIEGIEEGVVYALRVLGYNDGGDGRKSPTVYFTLEGQAFYNVATTELMGTGSYVRASSWVLLICCLSCFVNVR